MNLVWEPKRSNYNNSTKVIKERREGREQKQREGKGRNGGREGRREAMILKLPTSLVSQLQLSSRGASVIAVTTLPSLHSPA